MTVSDEVVGRPDAIICESRCVSLDDLFGELDGSMRPSHTVHSILKVLKYPKLWVPR